MKWNEFGTATTSLSNGSKHLQHHKTDSEFLRYPNLLAYLIDKKVHQDYLYTYLEASANCFFGSSPKDTMEGN